VMTQERDETEQTPASAQQPARRKSEKTHINVWIDPEASRMLDEIIEMQYPGAVRVQGAIVGRAIRELYKQLHKEQRS
jgi:hypothetical protein